MCCLVYCIWTSVGRSALSSLSSLIISRWSHIELTWPSLSVLFVTSNIVAWRGLDVLCSKGCWTLSPAHGGGLQHALRL